MLRSWSAISITLSVTMVLMMIASAPVSRSSAQTPPTLGGCPILPADNIWNAPVDQLPVDPNSNAYLNTIGGTRHAHADFGSGLWDGGPIGIPFVVVPQAQPLVSIYWTAYGGESDPGPYPIPPAAPIEGGPASSGDRHVLVLRQGECKLFELYRAFPNANGSWDADSGAVYPLTANGPLRPAGWTSADAAGLPILPGLVRYDEVAGGEINHAIRFTVPQTRRAYVWPARHFASSLTGLQYPPMGQRFRLKASFAIDNRFSPEVQVILRALKKYGLILADNGSAWYLSGAPDERWNNDHLHQLDQYVSGSDFEAVDVTSLMLSPDSGQAVQGFAMTVDPISRAINPGAMAAYQLTFTPSAAFTGNVTVAASSPSPSLTLQLSPINFTLPNTSTLNVIDTHPIRAPAQWYTILITATSASVTHTTSVGVLIGGAQVYLPVMIKN